MSGEMRIYREPPSRVIKRNLLALGVVVFLLFTAEADFKKRGTEYVRFNQNLLLIVCSLTSIGVWVFWSRNVPRLEIDADSIRYVSLGGYNVRIRWPDAERIDSWHDGAVSQRSITARKLEFQRSWWGKLFFEPDGAYKRFLGSSSLENLPAVNRGIPIEPMFVENIYRSEILNELQRYAPHILQLKIVQTGE